MEAASFLNTRLPISGAPAAPSKIKNLVQAPSPSLVKLRGRPKAVVAARCVAPSGGSVVGVERELVVEGEEMGRWVEKCGGQGVVELLECLEREAIMGEDEGKEPHDYNRRARIFEKSSRVFRALREGEAAPSPGPS
ncbi:uncharacterized protein LOC116189523 [Punica granatum]|uniref:Uncharacterized protein LOC116189523 n=1 Tax=Punica granatum TaxID=22663 RepID=A0A218XQS5_PUNGR|nr:uncharacterized protein LOC116189523 [Punica granatum]OWM87327.1 hypothetical protein CDL15_Pgr022438 [Punica granatum]